MPPYGCQQVSLVDSIMQGCGIYDSTERSQNSKLYNSIPFTFESFYDQQTLSGMKDHCEGTELESHQTAIIIFLLPLDGLVQSYICSAQSGNLRNLEIALRILRIRKLRTNLEIAQWVYAISRLRSTSAQSRDCAAPVRNLVIAQHRYAISR